MTSQTRDNFNNYELVADKGRRDLQVPLPQPYPPDPPPPGLHGLEGRRTGVVVLAVLLQTLREDGDDLQLGSDLSPHVPDVLE